MVTTATCYCGLEKKVKELQSNVCMYMECYTHAKLSNSSKLISDFYTITTKICKFL